MSDDHAKCCRHVLIGILIQSCLFPWPDYINYLTGIIDYISGI